MTAKISVGIVTYNSQPHLKACIEGLKAQSYGSFSVRVWDNASKDATPAIIDSYSDFWDSVILSERNLGFCAAQNRLIAASSSEYVLVLNPDVVLEPRFLEILVREMDADPRTGSATGKLLRSQSTGPPILDSTGIYMTPNQRHLDRGSGETDKGQYDEAEYVFGASGAAAFFRRTMLEDIRNGDEFFDESFFCVFETVKTRRAWSNQILFKLFR